MRNVSDKRCRENQNTFCMINSIFFENRAILLDSMEKYCRSGQATDDNMTHAHCMLDTKGYKHTLGVCHITAFPLQ